MSKKKKLNLTLTEAVVQLRDLQGRRSKFDVAMDSSLLGEFSSVASLNSKIREIRRFVAVTKANKESGV